jgi:hypothetical protein
VNPNASEVLYNGIDDDCNVDTNDGDADGDGFVGGADGPDCNDGAADVNPMAMEVTYNGVDDDCNPATRDDDLDNDGVNRADDCDDNNGDISPNVTENFNTLCDDGVDNDCRGGDVACDANVQDADGDGVADDVDCAPMDATIPGPREIVNNGLDDDCDPATPDGCDDDLFEGDAGNDTDGAATGVDDHNGTGEQYAGLVACPGNEDWYRIDIAAGDGLEADVHFTHANGDIDVALYKLDADGTLAFVDGSVGVDDDETVYERRAATDTTYYVKVYGFDPVRNTYGLTVNVFADCADDLVGARGEHNDSLTETAALPEAGETRQICDYDDDWYTFTVDAAATSASTALHPRRRRPRHRALSRRFRRAARPLRGRGDGEVIETMLERGTYSVRVYGFAGAKNAYRLFLSSGRTATARSRCPARTCHPRLRQRRARARPRGSVLRRARRRHHPQPHHPRPRHQPLLADRPGGQGAVERRRRRHPLEPRRRHGRRRRRPRRRLPALHRRRHQLRRPRLQEFAGLPADGIFSLVVTDNATRDTGDIANLEVEIEYFLP